MPLWTYSFWNIHIYSHRKITMTRTQTRSINRIALRAGKKGARPAEVGALASVFEKSATELKLKQKLLKCKQTIQITRHAGHCWRSKDELISDVLLWTPTHGCARVGRPARTYIQQLCEDTGCNPEDLPEAMNDREKWRETVRDIRAGGATWWWWWYIISTKAQQILCHYEFISRIRSLRTISSESCINGDDKHSFSGGKDFFMK